MATRWFSLMVVGLVQGAGAQDVKPTVAPAPLELRRRPEAISKKDQDQLLGEFDRLVRAAGARVPTPSEMVSALADLKRQDFASSDEALAQLAQKAQTLYGVYVQLDYPVTGTVVGVGKVVRADGKRIGQEVHLERSREARTYLQATNETIVAVLEKLELQRLPSSLPVVVTEPVKPAVELLPKVKVEPPQSQPPLVIREESILSQRLVGKLVLVGGAAAILGGLITVGLASSDAGGLTPDARQYLPPEQVELYRSAKSKQTTGAVLVGVGAAVAITGGVLWMLASDESSVGVSVAPVQGGVTAMLGGTF